jgi:hypothetical protein
MLYTFSFSLIKNCNPKSKNWFCISDYYDIGEKHMKYSQWYKKHGVEVSLILNLFK